MVYFDSDYMAGGHPAVMNRLMATNLEHTVGYGRDHYTAEAREMILSLCGLEHGEVFFFEGGTQTNATIIDALLRNYQGVLAADNGHINVHEAGAVEAWGHKVLTLPGHDGKLDATEVADFIDEFYSDDTNEHMVAPGAVYISYPTELGTIYSRAELTALYEACSSRNVPLFIDGARLAYGLNADGNELTLRDIASLCDVFYIGGTKCGALFGEAMVTRRPELFPRFTTLIKRHGAMLAKGRLLGVQFLTLMSNGLYDEIGRHAVKLAAKMKAGFAAKGYELYIDSPTNQQFFVLPNETIARLRENFSFELWGPMREKATPVRFVTDWTTTENDIDSLLGAL